MAFVNKVNIKKNHIRNCEEFASCFLDIIDKETAEYYEVCIIFRLCDISRYIDKKIYSVFLIYTIYSGL